VATYTINRMFSGLFRLAEGARRIARGENVTEFELEAGKDDEIGILAKELSLMSSRIQGFMKKAEEEANRDPLTGVGNSAAFRKYVDSFEKSEKRDFAVIIFNVNYVKLVNDALGDEKGDKLIQTAVELISRVVPKRQIYRVSGDEFVVLLSGVGLIKAGMSTIKSRFSLILNDYNSLNTEFGKWGLWIAMGYECAKASDNRVFRDVYSCADKAMHNNKIAIKRSQMIDR